ncbi:MAG: MFS transporter [Candidatus Bathyarchaeota archaeon]|nr:MFS transporter [Candidatus Bathyarchaeota archaeon]
MPFTKMGIPLKVALGNMLMIANVFVWYFYASAILRDAIDEICFVYCEKLIFYIILFLGAIVSILAGASLVNKLTSRKYFLLTWNLIGVLSSLSLVILENATIANVSFLLPLVSVSFGLGLPICLASFSDVTKEENRARFGSIVILSMFFGVFAFGFIVPANLSLYALVLAAWRLSGLVGFLLLGSLFENGEHKKNYSIISLFKDRSVLLYFVPWTMFSLINYLSWSICSRVYEEEFIESSVLVTNIIAGIFALVAGFLADNIGRKPTLVSGFIIFGIGYAVLGIYPFNIYAWYLYTIIDGIAWGIIGVIFWFTIWGDLAHEKSSEKYYALGLLPYALSGFLRVTLGPFIMNMVSEYAIFSFAALFLFLAVVPLMYAPETLPEKKIRERELRAYIEKAKKIKEKYA